MTVDFTPEEIAGGVDKDIVRSRSPKKVAVLATLLASTALFAAFVFKSKTKPPTVH
jgi:hypothetical protein